MLRELKKEHYMERRYKNEEAKNIFHILKSRLTENVSSPLGHNFRGINRMHFHTSEITIWFNIETTRKPNIC